MRPNLSVEKIAGALAVLGTSVLIGACGGENKPPETPAVNATETPATGEAKPADGRCGAGKDHKPGEANCGAQPVAETPPAEAPTPAAAAPAEPETKAADAKPADAKPDAKKPEAKKPAAAPKKGGAANCGAGTCASKK